MSVRYTLVAIGIAALTGGSVNPASAQAHTAYVVEDLGSFGGRYLVGLAINDMGDIAGYGELRDGSFHAFRWTVTGGLEDLGANGGFSSQAAGINHDGDVVGVYIDQYFQPHGFIAPRAGAMRDASTAAHLIWRVNGITDDGRIAGMLFAPNTMAQVHAFRTLADGTLEDLGSEFSSESFALNAGGDVTGFEAHDPNGANTARAFRFSDAAGKSDLATLGGTRSTGLSINSSGVIVGWSEVADANIYSRAFRGRPGFPMEDLGTLGGRFAGAESVNDAGVVAGWSESSSGIAPFLFTDADGMLDIRRRIPAVMGLGRGLDSAHAIGNGGHVVVGYYTANGYGTLRLSPVPDYEPPAVTATPDHDVLTPPDGKMIPVYVTVEASDNFDAEPTCGIVSVRNTEASASGVDPDVQMINPFTVNLRATRLGNGNGRTYTLAVRCTDFAGNATTVETLVRVPHDSAGKE